MSGSCSSVDSTWCFRASVHNIATHATQASLCGVAAYWGSSSSHDVLSMDLCAEGGRRELSLPGYPHDSNPFRHLASRYPETASLQHVDAAPRPKRRLCLEDGTYGTPKSLEAVGLGTCWHHLSSGLVAEACG